MKSPRLFSAVVAGALLLTVGGVASAAPSCTPATCKTNVSVTVLEGTTLTAPASINVGSAFPGQTADSGSYSVSWYSNEYPLQLSVALDGNLVNSVASTSILASNVTVTSDDYATPAAIDSAKPVADVFEVTAVAGGTRQVADDVNFQLHVFIPSATEGTYTQTMTWSVQ